MSVQFELNEGEYYLLKFMDPEFKGETSGSTSNENSSFDEISFRMNLGSELDPDSSDDSSDDDSSDDEASFENLELVSDSDSDSITSSLQTSILEPGPRLVETCTICYEDFPFKTLPIVSSSCTHEPSACKACISESLTADQSSKILRFDCPTMGCGTVLEYPDIQRLADKEVFERYDRELNRYFLKTIPNFLFCGASSSCYYGEELAKGTTTMKCATCGSVTCVECEVVHENVTCEQFKRGITAAQARDEEVVEGAKWVEENAKTCPGCQRIGWRESGCDHMECKSRRGPYYPNT